jgi:hypothetical protein
MALFCLTVRAAQTIPSTPAFSATLPASRPDPTPRQRAANRFLARRGLHPGLPSNLPSALLSGQQPRNQIPPRRAPRPAAATGSQVWTLVGPTAVNSLNSGLVTGRISALAFDPSDPSGNHLYLGTTGGGIWKSQNAAATNPASIQFQPITDNLPALSGALDTGLSVGAITVQPGATGTILAGLGDPNDALDSYYGAGLLRSTDNGQTWSLIQQSSDLESGLSSQDYSFVGEGFAGFAWSTSNTQLVVAAVSQASEATLVNAGQTASSYQGLYWSTDAGATWHLAQVTDPNGLDIQGPADGFTLPDGNAATSVVWNPVRQLFFAAIRYHGYYQSPDGQSWTRSPAQPGTGLTAANCPTQAGTLGVAGCPIFRGTLAVNPQTGDTFAWTVDVYNQDQGIWQDPCSFSSNTCTNPTVTFRTRLLTTALETVTTSGPATILNGDYNLSLAAIPGGPGLGQDTLLFAGGNDLFKCSLANSCQWRNTTNTSTCNSAQVGEYQHATAQAPANSPTLVFGTDSGLWRSPDMVAETGTPCATTDAPHFQNLNASIAAAGSLTEVSSLAQSANTPATMLTGLGAVGTAGIVNAPATAGDWNELLSGEGGPVAIDSTSTINSWYVNNSSGVSILHCASASACNASSFGPTPVIGESQVQSDGISMPYPAEFLIDPYDHTQLLIGTCRLWRGPASGSGWTSANAISPILDGTANASSQFCSGNALIRTIAALPITGGGEILYVGMAGVNDGGGSLVAGHLFSATLAANGTLSSWTDLAYSPVLNSGLAFNPFNYDISSIYVDPHDVTGSTVYAAISAFSSAAQPLKQIYRSTDAGAHWTIMEANLPNLPVNALAVDPQDPNTLYAATDAGVYLTRSVSTCASAAASACWAPYGAGLPVAPVTTLIATGSNATSLTLTAGTYGRGIWQIPAVTAGATLTTAALSPTTLTFPARTVGSASTASFITLKTTGNAALTTTSVAFIGAAASDYSETDTCTGITLAKGVACTLKVVFTPAQPGTRNATLVLNANVAGGQITIPLSGTGLSTGALSLLPTSLSFGPQQVAATSAVQSFSLQNTGGTAVTLASTTVTAPFVRTASTCTTTLAAGAACAISVAFSPTQSGAATGSLNVIDSVGTQSAALSGTGVLAPTDTLSTTAVTLPTTVIGQTSVPQTVTLTNSGGSPLTSIGLALANSATNDFSTLSNCGSQLAAGSSCGITVQFAPTVAITESATLTISDALRAQAIHITGTGLKPPLIAFSATSIFFPSQQVNLPSAARSVTLINKGGSPLATPSFSISGASAASFAVSATTCLANIPSGGTCTVSVIFTPVASGPANATLTAATSSPGVAPLGITLTGTGLTPPTLLLSPIALNLGSVALENSSSTFTVLIANSGQVTMNLPTFAITSTIPAQAADFALNTPTDITPCTAALSPAATCNIQVVFSPSVLGPESATLVITASNAVPPVATVSLTGVGTAPLLLESSATALNFPATPVGTSSVPRTFTLSNIGKKTANSLALTLTGPYTTSTSLTNCKPALPANQACTVGVLFNPTANGNQPGTITATVSNNGVPPLTVSLDGSGTAVGGIAVAPTQFTFGSVVVKALSTAQTLTITNSGQAALTGLKITVNGDFSLTGNQCPAILAAAFNCTTGISFSPSVTGIRTGTLTVSTTSAGVVPSVVPLTGNGIPAGSLTPSPAVLSFGTFLIGQTSSPQTVTLSNVGTTTLAGLQFHLAGDFGLPSNSCLAQLAPASVCTFTVNFSPSLPGTRIGAVTITSTNSGFIPVIVGLTGNGLPTAQLAASPLQLAFPSVITGANSAPLQITVHNPGTGTLLGLNFATVAPFSVGSGTCPTNLTAGATCIVPVLFSPHVTGPQSGAVQITSTSLGVPSITVALTGTGLGAPAFTWSPTTLTFPPTSLLTAAPPQTLTLSNLGGANIAGLTLAITSSSKDFAIASTTCGSSLPAGATCTAQVAFTPSLSGGRQATLTASSATPGVLAKSVALSGTGLTPATLVLNPASLTFPVTLIGQSSPPIAAQVLALKNTGQSAVPMPLLTLSGDFILSTIKTSYPCGPTLAPGGFCLINLLFTPTTGGPATGSVTASVPSQPSVSPATVALNGTGAFPPGFLTTPAALIQFPTTGVNQSAAPIAVTITNKGGLSAITGLTLSISTQGLANGFSLGSSSCTATLAALASCTVKINFLPTHAPSVPASLAGSLSIAASNAATPTNLALAGSAFDFSLVAIGAPTQSIVQGQTAYYTLAVTPLGSTSGAVTFTCGTLPAKALCLFNPAELNALPANLTSNIALGLSTGKATSTAQPSALSSTPTANRHRATHLSVRISALLGSLFLALIFLRRNRIDSWKNFSAVLSVTALVLTLGAITSCAGAGGTKGLTYTGGGTPPGSYPITITATSDGITRTAHLNLTVN